MWPIPAVERKFVSISFSVNTFMCDWIERTAQKSAPLILRAHQQHDFDNFELEHLVPFNPTIIKECIGSFLQRYNLTDAFVTFALCGSGVMEKFVIMPTSTPKYADFGFTNSGGGVLWEYRYLYPYDHGQYMFYVYAVQRSLILQYQLLAIAVRCNLIAITTKTIALLNAYKYIFGPAFRQSQLAVDMMRCNNVVDNLITLNTLRRMMIVTGDVTLQECSYYAAAAGLFISEGVDI